MRWIGKVVGGLLGLAGGPVGVALGAAIGHSYDVAAEGRALSDILREIPPTTILQRKVPCAWENKGSLMRMLTIHAKGKPSQFERNKIAIHRTAAYGEPVFYAFMDFVSGEAESCIL